MESTETALPAGTPNAGPRVARGRRRAARLAAGAMALIAALGVAGVLGVSPAHAEATGPTQTASIIATINSNNGSNMVVDVDGGNTAWLTPIDAWPANGGENQKWRFVAANPTWEPCRDGCPMNNVPYVTGTTTLYANPFLIENEPNSDGQPECLDAEGATPTAGDPVDLYGCNPNSFDQANQLWYPIEETNGIVELVNGISVVDMYQTTLAEGYTGVLDLNGDNYHDIFTANPPGNGPGESNAALVLTTDGKQGDQLTLEPSWYPAYNSGNGQVFDTNQDWTVAPTPYAVAAPQVNVPANSTVNEDYGCLLGWAPYTYTENQLPEVWSSVTESSDVTAWPTSISTSDYGIYNLVDPLLGYNSGLNGIQFTADNSGGSEGWAQITYHCVVTDPGDYF